MKVLPTLFPSSDALPGRVNLKELAEVRREHMPAVVVRFAPVTELERVAQEVTTRHPHLLEETAFVVVDEMKRRWQTQRPRMHLVR